jgi:hypothetical protein
MRKPPFNTIKQFDARGAYPGKLKELPPYEHPTFFHPLGMSSSADLNDPQNRANALARLEANYNKDKAAYVPTIIIIYNYGLTLIARHVYTGS